MRNRRNRMVMRIMMLATVVTMGCTDCGAQLILDQAYEPIPNWGLEITAGQSVAQSFTVGRTGFLGQVELFVNHHQGVCAEDLIVSLVTSIDGLPTPNVLATMAIAPSEVPRDGPATVMVDFSSDLIWAWQGDTLGIVLSSSATGLDPRPTFVWHADIGGSYPWGFASVSIHGSDWGGLGTNKDMGFKTYVDALPIPEPTALPFLGICFVVLVFLLRRASCRR